MLQIPQTIHVVDNSMSIVMINTPRIIDRPATMALGILRNFPSVFNERNSTISVTPIAKTIEPTNDLLSSKPS